MSKITFLPKNITVDANEGETVLDIANKNDIHIPQACGGNGACGTCLIILKEGTLSPKDDMEEIFGLEENERLACLAKVSGTDLVVEIV